MLYSEKVMDHSKIRETLVKSKMQTASVKLETRSVATS